MGLAALLFASFTVAAAAFSHDASSELRVAYVFGPAFEGPHDAYKMTCPDAVDHPHALPAHETLSVGVTCDLETRVSSVIAGLDWVFQHGVTDSTIVIPAFMRGNSVVEARLEELRRRGSVVPHHDAVRVKIPGHARHTTACVCVVIAMGVVVAWALARRDSKLRGARSSQMPLRRYTWSMTSKDRQDREKIMSRVTTTAYGRDRDRQIACSRSLDIVV